MNETLRWGIIGAGNVATPSGRRPRNGSELVAVMRATLSKRRVCATASGAALV